MVSFKKRDPVTTADSIKDGISNIFWPKIGMSRFLKYLLLKIKRLKGSPYALASGFATGVAVSFTPLIGFHFLIAILITYITRGSIVSTLFGTLIGNPWTLPIIVVFDYRVGSWILNIKARNDAVVVDSVSVDFSNIGELFSRFISIIQDPFTDPFIVNVLFPSLVGSIPFIVISWIVTYIFGYTMYKKIAELRKIRLQKRSN